jgi:hypothetical protein
MIMMNAGDGITYDAKKKRFRFAHMQRSENSFTLDLGGSPCLITDLKLDFKFDHPSNTGRVTVIAYNDIPVCSPSRALDAIIESLQS